ncbi:MAG: FUSC family membrane protein, partial [Bacteroidota bacterium]
LLEQQIIVHEKQNLVRELLFKSRGIIRESTTTGRILVMLFLDIVDLFESVMTSQYDYKTLHSAFTQTDILERFRQVIVNIADSLDETGIAVKSASKSQDNTALQKEVTGLQEYFENFRDSHRTAENVESFISLRHILDNIKDIADRLYTLNSYTAYEIDSLKKPVPDLDYEKFITHTDIDSKLLKDNLTFKSNIFRHSLRVSIATIAGFIIAQFFPFGHSYWILLTVIVILKPAYSLTKKRNYDRLLGTVGGALVGLILLYFI